jgi:threonine dehydrogenase-like Zn-dependent dehydrogenase
MVRRAFATHPETRGHTTRATPASVPAIAGGSVATRAARPTRRSPHRKALSRLVIAADLPLRTGVVERRVCRRRRPATYRPKPLDWAATGELDPSFLATHRFSLAEGAKGYDLCKNKRDGCVRVVFAP